MAHNPVVLACLDSLRPDYLKYMPCLSRLAEEGVFFEDSRTVFPSDTCPAHMSLLTGCYAERNGYSFGFYKNPSTDQYTIGQLKPFEDYICQNSILGAASREGLRCVSISIPGLNESYPSFLKEGDRFKNLGYEQFRKGETTEWVFNAAIHCLENVKFNLLLFTDFSLDDSQHKHGCHSKESIENCKRLDDCMGVLWERMKEDVNLIVVSDHGQTNTENMINLEVAFEELSLDALNSDGGTAYMKLGDEKEEKVTEIAEGLEGVDHVLDQEEKRNRRALFQPYIVDGVRVYPADIMIDAKENWSFDYRGPLY